MLQIRAFVAFLQPTRLQVVFGVEAVAWHNRTTARLGPKAGSCGEMDITAGFEPAVGGSNPSERT